MGMVYNCVTELIELGFLLGEVIAMRTLRRLFDYFRPYIGILVFYVVIGVIIVALAMGLPLITKSIIESVIGNTAFSFFGIAPAWSKSQLMLVLALVWIGIILLRQGLSYARGYMIENMSQKAVNKIREDIFERLLSQSQTYLRSENTGNIMTILTGDANMVKNFFTSTIPVILEAIVGFIFASIMISRMNIYMVLLCYVFVPPIFLLSRRFGKKMHDLYSDVRDASAELSMRTQENITGIRIVKAYAQEAQECERFEKVNGKFRYAAIQYMVYWAKYYIPFGIIAHLPNIVLTMLNIYLTVKGYMTIGEFVAVGGFIGYILTPFQQINNWINQAQQAITSGEKVFTFINTGSVIAEPKQPLPLKNPKYNVEMHDVSFSSNGKTVVKDINLSLPYGKKLGVVGATGSGKTMLINLLDRFFDPTQGEITIDGINIKSIPLHQLRSSYGLVIQDVFLFSETVENNIAFYNPEATLAEVQEAARIAQADGFIREMPDGYDTIVGERGMGLSGGQKQRISIARALLKDAPILVFDDATSALDMETEYRLQQELKHKASGHTQIIIAHRISSVKNCDEIIVLDKGHIIERGTHDQLVAKKGHYYEIYHEQYGALEDAVL